MTHHGDTAIQKEKCNEMLPLKKATKLEGRGGRGRGREAWYSEWMPSLESGKVVRCFRLFEQIVIYDLSRMHLNSN